MKKNLLFYSLFIALFIAGCTKDDGPIRKAIKIDEVPQPVVVKNGGSTNISMANLAAFNGIFDVKLLYPLGIKPAKMDVVIRKNLNNSNVKVFKVEVTTFPSTFTISAAEIATLFGAPIVAGDNYDIGVDIYTTTGNKYEAFPLVGAAYGNTGVANQPGFSVTIRYTAS